MLKSHPLNILKIQSESSMISNLGQIFIFTENCTPNYPLNHFSYPLTIVQISCFEEPQNIFFQPKSQTLNYWASPPPPRIFNYRIALLGIFVSSFWLFNHRSCAILSSQNKSTLGWGSTYFQFASISFEFELIRVLSDCDWRMVYDNQANDSNYK